MTIVIVVTMVSTKMMLMLVVVTMAMAIVVVQRWSWQGDKTRDKYSEDGGRSDKSILVMEKKREKRRKYNSWENKIFITSYI